jgi:hypothetical protein
LVLTNENAKSSKCVILYESHSVIHGRPFLLNDTPMSFVILSLWDIHQERGIEWAMQMIIVWKACIKRLGRGRGDRNKKHL